MKKIELEDGEFNFIMEMLGKVSIPGASAKALVALQEKFLAANVVVLKDTKEK